MKRRDIGTFRSQFQPSGPRRKGASGFRRNGNGGNHNGARRTGMRYSGREYMNKTTMGFLGIEKKFYDTALVSAALTAPSDSTGGEHDPSATSMISTPVRGDSEQNRDGKQIALLNVSIKGSIDLPPIELAAAPKPGVYCYVALVLDTQTNGAILKSEDVFKNTGADNVMAANPMKNLLFMSRFRILKSLRVNMTVNTLSHVANDAFSNCGKSIQFNWFVNLKGLKVSFNAGTTADVANVIDNSLHIIAFSTSVAPAPALSYNARIRFVG